VKTVPAHHQESQRQQPQSPEESTVTGSDGRTPAFTTRDGAQRIQPLDASIREINRLNRMSRANRAMIYGRQGMLCNKVIGFEYTKNRSVAPPADITSR